MACLRPSIVLQGTYSAHTRESSWSWIHSTHGTPETSSDRMQSRLGVVCISMQRARDPSEPISTTVPPMPNLYSVVDYIR